MQARDSMNDDPALAGLLHDYIELYRGDALDRWRTLFLPEFVALSTNSDGSLTTWGLDAFVDRQRKTFATGKPIREFLENVRCERSGPLASVHADFVWTDGEISRRGRLVLLVVEQHGALRIQSLAFGYG